MNKIIFLGFLAILFASCEKVIDLKLDQNSSKYVIEGNITNEAPPYTVKITKSVNFSQSSIYPNVGNALVIIRDNIGTIDTLSYKNDGIYQTNSIVGMEGRTYHLKVLINGQVFESTSIMPAKVELDSIGITQLKIGGQTSKLIIPRYTDPLSYGHSYQFLVYRNNQLDKSYTVTNDDVNNGMPNQRPIRSVDFEFETGDTARVEMRCVSSPTYLYYFTLAQMASNGPGGGTTPSNPPNNMTGGALGLFSAHTSQFKSIIIP